MEKILPNLNIYVVDKKDGKGVSALRLMLPAQTADLPLKEEDHHGDAAYTGNRTTHTETIQT